MRTLVRSVAVHNLDPSIRMFGRLLDSTYSSNDQAFFLVVRSLCRYGVPRRAWTIGGMPVGGRYGEGVTLSVQSTHGCGHPGAVHGTPM